MLTNNNGPLVTAQDFALEVARGRVEGADPFVGYGRKVTGAIANTIIWPGTTPFLIPDQDTGVTLSFKSTSASDTFGGAGVQQVEIHYLDINLDFQQTQVKLNGTTLVSLDVDGNPITGVRFVQCLHVDPPDDNPAGPAVGTITAEEGGAIYSLIAAGEVRCTSSARMVPRGKRAIVPFLIGSSVSSTSDAESQIAVAATELDNHQYTRNGLFIPFGAIGVQNGGNATPISVPGVFKEGTVVAMLGSASKAATLLGGFFGWTEDAP